MINTVLSRKNIFLVLASIHSISFTRSIHRAVDPHTPQITAHWATDNSKQYSIANYHLDAYPFFHIFDKDFFDKHLLPEQTISYRHEPEKSIRTQILKNYIDELLEEIKKKKRSFKHFIVLQNKDFNRRKGHGLLILKFKDYPFVVKLFIERPDSFISPYHKGFEPIFFFYMGGGINRHIAGFTRIKNLEQIKQKLSRNPELAACIDTPRKWYWVPKNCHWITLEGKNLNNQQELLRTEIPGTYCIIADAIDAEKKFSLFDSSADKKIILDICNYLDLWLDPHLNNYMIEKKTQKIILVDTEHFASVVGLKEPVHFDSYTHWYVHLAKKFLQNTFGQTKKERKNHIRAHIRMQLC